MASEPIFANNLAATRVARGIGTAEELARLVGIDLVLYEKIEAGEILPRMAEADRLAEVLGVDRLQLYIHGLDTAIGAKGVYQVSSDQNRFFQDMRDPLRLLVFREELRWLERAVDPDRPCDVFVNMSCSTQMHPHLLLETTDVLRALGVDFAAGSGPDFCCGGYFRGQRKEKAADRMVAKSVEPALARQATTHVHWCTQCVNNFTAASNRREAESGQRSPLRNIQLLPFLVERLQELGDDVPWVRSVDPKVVVHGHTDESPTTTRTRDDAIRLLELIPGVEVVGALDRTFMDDFCNKPDPVSPRAYPTTPTEMQAMRHEIAAITRSFGADTVCPQHQECSRFWAPFASVDMAVRNPVSILAEALGCDHPDRSQAAFLLADADAVVEQTRSIWTTWDLTEEKAREIAEREFKSVTAANVMGCSCGRGACGREIVDIDVLQGVDWREAVAVAIGGDDENVGR